MGGVASELVGASRERQSRKRKQFHTVELKVRMDCDGCELKVRNTLASMRDSLKKSYWEVDTRNGPNADLMVAWSQSRILKMRCLTGGAVCIRPLGVESVEINRKQQKVTVKGFVEALRVLRRAQSTGKRVELWPYVPYTNLYVAPPVYDKRAPPGHIRRVDAALIAPAGGGQEDNLATLFSDDNPNACSLM